MGRTVARLTALAVTSVGCALAAAPAAWADSASVTDFKKVDSTKYSATFTVTSDGCRPDGVCEWFAYAVQGPGDQPCTDYVEGDGRLSWTGGRHDGPGTFTESAAFVPIHESLVICVYINRGEGSTPALVGELRQTVAVELGKGEAIGQMRRIIRRETKAKPTFFKASRCQRLSQTSFECIAAWINRKKVWAGTLTVSETGSDYPYKFVGFASKLSCIRRYPKGKGLAACRRKVRW